MRSASRCGPACAASTRCSRSVAVRGSAFLARRAPANRLYSRRSCAACVQTQSPFGLVGERGREAQRWIALCDDRTTVICATSDRAANERVRAADLVMAHAQALAARGLHVLVVLDSLARYAHALREIAVQFAARALGEAAIRQASLRKWRDSSNEPEDFTEGSITMLATVLNDGEDQDPVSECARSLLDGHIQLSPRLAHAGRFPAIDVLGKRQPDDECGREPQARSQRRAAFGTPGSARALHGCSLAWHRTGRCADAHRHCCRAMPSKRSCARDRSRFRTASP